MLRLDNVTAFKMATKWILNTNSKQKLGKSTCQGALERGQCQGVAILSKANIEWIVMAENDEVLLSASIPFKLNRGDTIK